MQGIEIDIIAPSHGLIWRNPREIIELYKKWAKYGQEPAERGVTLLYASMYGNTEKMMGAVVQGISKEGIPVKIFDVRQISIGTCFSLSNSIREGS